MQQTKETIEDEMKSKLPFKKFHCSNISNEEIKSSH